MSEIGVIALVMSVSLPLTAGIVGFVCKRMMDRALEHIKETQVVGGTPRDAFIKTNDVKLAAKAARLQPRRATGVIS